jgi:class 3 adenylate cyclase/Flp pilus assembly protein TadD
MADLGRMDRTWLCSVVFTDIVDYSSQSVELQMRWKNRFNGYLTEAIRDVPESERVILDTGDGAAICFLGAPEAAMFAALQLCRAFVVDEREQHPGLRVRLGVNLGPVKLVKDINGALNAIGDGINAGQRIMSFAAANQILVSQSFFEVVSRLSDDYKPLFHLKGVQTDKHVREHTVYTLVSPGSEKREPTVLNAEGQALPSMPAGAVSTAARAERRGSQNRSILWLAGGAALVALAGFGAWHFRGSAAPATPNATATSVVQSPTAENKTGAFPPAPAVPVSKENAPPPVVSVPEKPASIVHPEGKPGPRVETATVANTPVTRSPPEQQDSQLESPSRPESVKTPVSPQAKAAYDEAILLLDRHNGAEAARRFDEALRISPDFLEAYVGRAQARRMLLQYELSLKDCNEIIRIKPDEPRGYNCRGYGYELLKQNETAIRDFNEAIRLNPDFAQAYADRGGAYSDLQQYDRAVQDYSKAIRLRPRNALFHMKRGTVFKSLKQYDKAIEDYTEAIRILPNDIGAFMQRASAEDLSGDAAGAAADRRHVRELRQGK